MAIFICWSGDRSHGVARAVATLLAETLRVPEGEVFVSDRIGKGVVWFDAIVKQLHGAKAGGACLTAENVESPWLHFETGVSK
jgi:hypothetical protein